MAWEIRFKLSANKAFNKLDKFVQRKIIHFLKNKIAPLDNPRVFGKPLLHDKAGLWRYRVEDHRVICQIDDNAITIMVVKVGHRKEVYDE